MQVLTSKRFEFSAAHRYWNAEWSPERNNDVFGKCTAPYGHGHNYVLEVTVAGEVNDATGMVINVTDLKRIVGAILQQFDHKHLNEDTPFFRDRQPTTENIVQVLWGLIEPELPEGVRLHRLRLYETPDLFAEFFGGATAGFGRAYGFSAAHRLDSAELSPAENIALYGKCNNLRGHGHDYRFELSVEGPVDPESGMVINLADLDRQMQPVLDELDHTHLDMQHQFFRSRPSTAENVVAFLWQRCSAAIGPRLRWIRLWETPNNIFEYGASER